MNISQIKKIIHNPGIVLSRMWVKMSPIISSSETFLKINYRLRLGKKLNLDHPHTFQEKTQWLKLHCTDSLYTQLVDKYEARIFLADRIGEEHLIPLLGVK